MVDDEDIYQNEDKHDYALEHYDTKKAWELMRGKCMTFSTLGVLKCTDHQYTSAATCIYIQQLF